MNINEVKYNQLNSRSKTQTIKDNQKAAHSQGYTLGDPVKTGTGSHFTNTLTHRKTGERVSNASGTARIGGTTEKGGDLDNTLRNGVSDAIKADRKARGGVDRRPAAKAKRKEEAAKNKAAKAKARDPFRRMKEGVTFSDFVSICEQTHARDL